MEELIKFHDNELAPKKYPEPGRGKSIANHQNAKNQLEELHLMLDALVQYGNKALRIQDAHGNTEGFSPEIVSLYCKDNKLLFYTAANKNLDELKLEKLNLEDFSKENFVRVIKSCEYSHTNSSNCFQDLLKFLKLDRGKGNAPVMGIPE